MTADRCRLRTAAVGLLLVTLTAGCGHSGPAVSRSASTALGADVTRLQAAATRGTATDLLAAAAAVRQSVASEVAAGSLSVGRAAAILDQLDRVLADAVGRPVAHATPTSTPKAPAPEKTKQEDNGGGEGD